MTEEQQQTTTPEAAAQDAPVEAAEAVATADPAVAVVEETAAAEAAVELADEAIVADAVAEGLVVEAVEAEAASDELADEAIVADAVAEELVAEAVVAEEASEELADEAEAAMAAGDAEAAEELAAESFAADEEAGELVADAVVAQDAAEELAAESFAADEVAGELVAEAVVVEAAAGELAEEAVAAQAVADDLAAELAHAPAAEPVEPLGPEPSTMAELLAEQDADIRSFKHGDVVEGTVVRIDRDEILVDIGAKSEGVVSNRELYGRNAESAPTLAIGDTVLVYVLQPESPEGHVVLSLRRAGLERKWRSMQEQFEAGVIIEAPVIDHNKGGLIVDCGIRGFVPISQIVDFPRRPQNEQPRDAAQEIAEKLQPYVGRRLRLKILEVNRKANRLILSEKVALYEERREKRDELFSSLQVGQKVTGSVRSIAPFGVFIDLGGIDGLVHKSELSWNKVNNPEAGYKVGDEVEAEVIDINHERGRISLSIRRLQPDPWHSTVADFRVGDVIEGTVTKLVNFGAFVRVRDGLEGLIHISELSHQRVAHPGDVVREGQTLKLKIISLDSERHRLGLSLKQAEEPPARPAPEARPRRDRPERGYSVSDAVQEPEGGIDNTLAAAFAQVRQQLQAAEAAETVEPATVEPAAEPAAVEAPEPEPVVEAVAKAAVVEAVLAEDAAEEAVAEAEEAEAVAEEAVVEAVLAEDAAEEAVAEAEEAEAVAEAVMADAAADDVAADAVADAVLAEEAAEEAVAEAAEADAVADEAVAEAVLAEEAAEEAVAEAAEADAVADEAVAEADKA